MGALLAQGADLNIKGEYGNTALIWAARNGHRGIVRALLAQGADLKIKGEYGHTALTLAAQHGHVAIVEALLAQGADPDARNNNGHTALMCAAHHWGRPNNVRCMRALRKAHASRHMLSGGKTPLTPQGDRRIRPNNRPHYTTLLNLFKEISGCDFDQVKRLHSHFDAMGAITLLIGITSIFLTLIIQPSWLIADPLISIAFILSIFLLSFCVEWIAYKITQPHYPTLKTVDPDQISTYLTEHNLTLQLSPSTTLNHSVLLIDQTDRNGQITRLAAVPWHQLDSNLRHNLQTYLQTWLHQNIELHFKQDQAGKGRLTLKTLKSTDNALHHPPFALSVISLLQTLDNSELEMLFHTHPGRFKEYGFSEAAVTDNPDEAAAEDNPDEGAAQDNPAETEKSDTIPLGIATLFDALPFLARNLDSQSRAQITQTCRGANAIVTAVAPPISIENASERTNTPSP